VSVLKKRILFFVTMIPCLGHEKQRSEGTIRRNLGQNREFRNTLARWLYCRENEKS
jgi:hypothetical protein